MADLFEEVQQNLQEHFKAAAPVQETAPTQEVIQPAETVAAPEVIPVTSPVVEPAAPAPSPGTEYYKDLGYESPDHLKSSLNDLKAAKEEYEKKLPYYSELEKEFENFVKIADPMNLFKSEKEYENFLIAQKMGEGKDFGVVQQIIRNDLSVMPDLDVLKLKWRFDTPSLANKSDDRVQKAILEDLGVDIDEPDFKLEEFKPTDSQEIKLARLATLARDQFNQAKASVQKPERPDYKKSLNDQVAAKAEAEKVNKEKFNQMAQTWQEKTKGLGDSISKFEFTEKNDKNEDVVDFVFNMDKEFVEKVPEMIMHHVLSNNLPPTQENVDYAKELVRSIYIAENYEKLAKAHTSQKLAEQREKLDKERYNGKDFNTNTPPPGRDEDLNKSINDGILKITGLKI
jgi:hypothetical protein